MERVLITGGSGFIGTNLVEYFVKKCNSKVLNVDINSPINKLYSEFWAKVDIKDNAKLTKVINEFAPNNIVHLAARTDLDGKSLESYEDNTKGVESLINACSEVDSIDKVLFASSRLVNKIGYLPKNDLDFSPNTFYGESKAIGEKICRKQKNKKYAWAILRPTSIWGPWFNVPYRNFFNSVRKGLYFHPSGRKIYKSFGYVGNSVYQIGKILDAPNEKINEKVFYIGDYPETELYKMSELIYKYFGYKKAKTIPVFLLKLIAMGGSCTKVLGFKNPPLTIFRLNNLLTEMVYDLSKTEEICGKLPFSLEEGIKKTVEWIKNNG